MLQSVSLANVHFFGKKKFNRKKEKKNSQYNILSIKKSGVFLNLHSTVVLQNETSPAKRSESEGASSS